MAQRLVRRLCPECRKEYTLNADELKSLKTNYDMERIFEVIARSGAVKMGKNEKAGDDKWGKIKLFKAVGCEQCNNEGYHGRLGIYEVLEVDAEIERMISQKATEEEIENKAKEKGMLTMVEDGFIKAAEGATSVEELLRVTRE
jgi:type II secretory ATPase GspE/PulE/Tfp pilus assembly ATPase PilB-like protein